MVKKHNEYIDLETTKPNEDLKLNTVIIVDSCNFFVDIVRYDFVYL